MNTKSSKPKLIILSDLWGKEKNNWLAAYEKVLDKNFTLTYYDCCELGEIDKTDYSEENLHRQFINGGIEKAATNLKNIEKNEVYILAFSIGGLIGWKASLAGMKIKGIFAISSTRLRYETEKPSGILELVFAEKDEFIPKNNWFKALKIKKNVFTNESHNFYENPKNVKKITDLLLQYV